MATTYDLGGGGNAFTFENIGDTITGKITNIAEQQQTDMDSGQPAFWEGGQPKMMVAVELLTNLRDPENPADDGKRTVYLKGSRKPEALTSMSAVLAAVKQATGSTQLAVGGVLTLTYAGDGVPSRKGYNPPKQYTAAYVPGAVNLDPGAGVPAGTQAGWAPPPNAQPVYQQGYVDPVGYQTPPQSAPATTWGSNVQPLQVAQAASGAQQASPAYAPPQAPPNVPQAAPQAPPQPDPSQDPGYAAYLAYMQSQQGGQQQG